jgi:hypothetical protein
MDIKERKPPKGKKENQNRDAKLFGPCVEESAGEVGVRPAARGRVRLHLLR